MKQEFVFQTPQPSSKLPPSRRPGGSLARRCVALLSVAFAPLLTGFLMSFLTGCGGGQDFGGFSRSLNGDISNGYNTSLGGRYGRASGTEVAGSQRGVYPRIETSFQLANLPGDPFDFEKVNVQVTLRKPDGGNVDVAAFYDGDTTWRMRYTPFAPGPYAVVAVKLNREAAHEEKLEKKDWTVSGNPLPGFVRVDKGDKSRFVLENGARYFPLGHNQAWHDQGMPDIPELFGKMHEAGENWSRVWMNHWDGKNLDWPATGKPAKLGAIDLAAAKRWDAIVDAATKNEIYLQMVLQHHGQYSLKVNSNWDANPYNAKNGGFLQSPQEFFTNPQARALTKRKLYYLLARWGYSPNIMAFELFNEVEFTEAAQNKQWDDIAMWHREMALFLRQFDGYHHLLTTSAAPNVPLQSPVWETVDYIQRHVYASDLTVAVGRPEQLPDGKKLDKPAFVGEFGPSGLKDAEGLTLHQGLWASALSGASGAAQYWDWGNVERQNLYPHFRALAGFLTASGLPSQSGLLTAALPIETAQRGALRFGAGGGWGNASQSEFVVGTNGAPAGFETFPAYLQGTAHRAMTPKPLTFLVSYAQPGTFAVAVAQVAKSGATLQITLDGKAVTRDFAAAAEDSTPPAGQETLQIEVPSGAHTIAVENTGSDWLHVRDFIFGNVAPALAATGRVGKEFAAAWVFHRSGVDTPAAKEQDLTPATGKLSLPGLQAGRYRATWWDTRAGKSLETTDLTVANDKEAATLTTPPITRDLALYVGKAGTPPAKSARRK